MNNGIWDFSILFLGIIISSVFAAIILKTPKYTPRYRNVARQKRESRHFKYCNKHAISSLKLRELALLVRPDDCDACLAEPLEIDQYSGGPTDAA